MTIAQQIATPASSTRARRPSAPLQPVPMRRPGRALARIAGLIMLTALGAAFVTGACVIGMMMFASSMGG